MNKLTFKLDDKLWGETTFEEIPVRKPDFKEFLKSILPSRDERMDSKVTIIVNEKSVTMDYKVFYALMTTSSLKQLTNEDYVYALDGNKEYKAKIEDIIGFGRANLSFSRVFNADFPKTEVIYKVGEYTFNYILFESLRVGSPSKLIKLMLDGIPAKKVKDWRV